MVDQTHAEFGVPGDGLVQLKVSQPLVPYQDNRAVLAAEVRVLEASGVSTERGGSYEMSHLELRPNVYSFLGRRK